MQHFMNLQPEPFISMQKGTKTVEMRLYDERRQNIKVGDTITFTNVQTEDKLTVIVKDIQIFVDFAELYRHFDKVSIGYNADEEANPDDMLAYYSSKQIATYGVVAIVLERLPSLV